MTATGGEPLSPRTHSAEDVVRMLQLAPLLGEGGWFRRIAEGEERAGFADGPRGFATIYALFTPQAFSALHRLTMDEIWCFHAGDGLDSLRLHPDGHGEWVRLGLDVNAGERPQDVVPAGVWQGARVVPGGRWVLVTCVTVPDFRWDAFTLGEARALSSAYPAFEADIRELAVAP